jgi:hypothetical protein
MKHLTLKNWSLVVLVYLLGGLGLGLADPQLRHVVKLLGIKPGVATAINVNLFLPLLAIVLGLVHRRLLAACFGAVGMTVAFVLGLAFVHPPAQPWDAATLFRAVPPVLVIACLGYSLLGSLAALVARHFLASPAIESNDADHSQMN